jgi:hypothetical protein
MPSSCEPPHSSPAVISVELGVDIERPPLRVDSPPTIPPKVVDRSEIQRLERQSPHVPQVSNSRRGNPQGREGVRGTKA